MEIAESTIGHRFATQRQKCPNSQARPFRIGSGDFAHVWGQSCGRHCDPNIGLMIPTCRAVSNSLDAPAFHANSVICRGEMTSEDLPPARDPIHHLSPYPVLLAWTTATLDALMVGAVGPLSVLPQALFQKLWVCQSLPTLSAWKNLTNILVSVCSSFGSASCSFFAPHFHFLFVNSMACPSSLLSLISIALILPFVRSQSCDPTIKGPISVPIRNVSLESPVVRRGAAVSIGTPPQTLAFHIDPYGF